VFDLIYTPADTALMRQARAEGCLAIGGLEMLVAQAERQFERWTRPAAAGRPLHRGSGQRAAPPPEERFREADDVRRVRGTGPPRHVRAGGARRSWRTC
jgi:hypothetical protein